METSDNRAYKRRGRPPKDRSILSTKLRDGEANCPVVEIATTGDVPQAPETCLALQEGAKIAPKKLADEIDRDIYDSPCGDALQDKRILFRPIRELLSESMEEATEVKTLDQLFDLCDFEGSNWVKGESKIEFHSQGYDDRIKWNSFLITIDGKAAGYTNGLVLSLNEELQKKYNEMHKQGPTSWFGDGVEERDLIMKMGQPWKDKTVLEIGCGEGILMKMICDEGISGGEGIDYSKVAIEKAEKKYGHILAFFVKADYREVLGIRDRVVMQGVLEHLDDPFTELKWMMDNLVSDYGDIITSSPGFINPRGIVWMTLDMLGAVMSKTDLHFINPWDMENFAKEHGYRVAMQCCDLDWAGGGKMIADQKQRIPLALKDGGLPVGKVDKFLSWLELATNRMQPAPLGGATIVYKIMK